MSLYNSSSSSRNLQWFITPVGTESAKSSAKSLASTNADTSLINDIFVYPNPVVSSATIKNAKNSTINIYDINSKVVFKQTFSNDQENIDLSSLSSGIYFAEIKRESTSEVIKLIKN